MESQVNYPQLCDPEFMRRFDLTMTYRLDSDVPIPYVMPGLPDELRRPPTAKTAEALAACFVSNEHDNSGRYPYIRELMRHLPVHSFGRVLRNKELTGDDGRETKLSTIARYRFTLAFENSLTTDYLTEKFFDPLIAGSVPVYRGAPNADQFAPGERCFINALDFGSPRELADYLNVLAGDPDRYDTYLAWKGMPLRRGFLDLVQRRTSPWCRLCERLEKLQALRPARAGASQRVAVVGHFGGLNISRGDARRFAREIAGNGIPVRLVDLQDAGVRNRREDRAEVALHFGEPPCVRREAGRLNVNYTVADTDPIPADWIRHSLTHDMVIVPSEFSANAWLRAGLPADRLRVCPPGVDGAIFHPDVEPLTLTDSQGQSALRFRTRVLNVSHVTPRANLKALLRTWMYATTVDDDAILIVKISGDRPDWQVLFMLEIHRLEKSIGKARHEAAPILFYETFLSDWQMARLFGSATHYWSMSHGEGWDQSMMRAGAAGLCLIAPDHSSYDDWLDESVAKMIPSRRLPADGWWEPDEEAAAAHLRCAIQNPGHAFPNARNQVVRKFSWERAGLCMSQILGEVQARSR